MKNVQNLTLVLSFLSVFLNIRITNGSALPIKSTAGKSSAEITVTDRTPLTITLLLLRADDAAISSASAPSFPLLRVFSNVVNEKSGSKGFLIVFSTPNGQYKSSKCTYIAYDDDNMLKKIYELL